MTDVLNIFNSIIPYFGKVKGRARESKHNGKNAEDKQQATELKAAVLAIKAPEKRTAKQVYIWIEEGREVTRKGNTINKERARVSKSEQI